MNTARAQRGQLLIAGIVLIVVVALMVAALGYLNVSGESSGVLHNQSERAHAAARSGIQYAAAQYYNGASCSSLSGQPVGQGSFVLTPTLHAPLAPTATSAALTPASAAITVASTAGYAPSGRILIDAELINYTSTTATTFGGLRRGAGGTTAAAHASGATVSQNLCLVTSKGTVGDANRTSRAALGAGTSASAGSLGTMGPDAMVVYAKGTALTGVSADRNVYFRLWDGSANAWGAEQLAQQVSANASPLFIAVQFARTRNEAIMGVLDGNNNIYIQVWNGRTWTIPAGGGPLATASSSCTTAPVGRCFQIAYEYSSDIARIVYQNSTRDPQHASWNGSTLAANGMVLSPSGAYSTAGSGTRHFWFRMAPRNVAGSNEILLMSFDSGQDVYGARWTGSAWNNMGTGGRWDSSTGTTNNREAIDVAWQSDGEAALFIWGDQNDRRVRYRTWTESTATLAGSVQTTFAFPGGYVTSGTPDSRFEWIRLYPGPSNAILAVLQTGFQSTGPALLSAVWSSGSFTSTAAVGHDNGTVESDTSRAFDFAWETSPGAAGRGWLLWGSRAGGPGTGVMTRYFTSPVAWSAPAAIRDRSLLVQSGVLLPSGRFVSGVYQAAASASDDIESVTTGGGGTAWPNAAAALWTGPTTLQLGERVFIATRGSGYINTGASATGTVSVLQQREIVQ